MNTIASADIGYLLLIIPGFIFLWTFRYFTRASKMGEFEYAGWSFVWGVLLFLFLGLLQTIHLYAPTGKTLSIVDSFSFLAALTGTSIGMCLAISFPLGLLFAACSKTKFFKWVHKSIFNIVDKLSQ